METLIPSFKVISGPPPRDARPGEPVALDIEMYGQRKPLHLPTGRFACMSVYLGGDEVYQVYDLHGMREALNRMRPGLWCLQNSLYDLRHLRRFAPVPEVPVWDTLLVSLHLSAGLYKLHGLPELSRRELGVKMEKVVRNEFEKATEMTPEMKQYAAEDAWATRHIALRQMDVKAKGIVSFTPYDEITSKAIWAVLDMRKVRFDKDAFIGLAKTFGDQGRTLQAQLGINVNSTIEARAFAGSILGREMDSTAAAILDPIIGSY